MNLDRREFVTGALAGAGLLATGGLEALAQPAAPPSTDPFQMRKLGKTGVKVSLIGLGTGMSGFNRQSNHTRMGREKFNRLVQHAYERGVRLFDCADIYGTHSYLAEALQGVPRKSYAIATKIWYHQGGIPEVDRPEPHVFVERFLKELKTDTIDVLQLHCMQSPEWQEPMARHMEGLEELKRQKVIRAHGISIHNLGAMRTAVSTAWVDACHVRINAYGDSMDDRDPEKVVPVIRDLHKAGKGVIGMKLAGEGRYRNAPEKRLASVRYALATGAVDTMVVGCETPEEIDDFAALTRQALEAMKA
jgi:aryl-alcohol dehydrogenase-like predicted oxidoreductase